MNHLGFQSRHYQLACRGQQEHFSQPSKQNHQTRNTAADQNPFRFDTTFSLCKKFFIYKMMASNIFINYSLSGMRVAYRLLGIKLTNKLIESTAASIFTGGVTLQDLIREIRVLENRGVGTISMSVVEGLRNVPENTLDEFLEFSEETVRQMTEGRSEAHFAVKLTAFVSMEIMEKVS